MRGIISLLTAVYDKEAPCYAPGERSDERL
jgi:hypothetical protein